MLPLGEARSMAPALVYHPGEWYRPVDPVGYVRECAVKSPPNLIAVQSGDIYPGTAPPGARDLGDFVGQEYGWHFLDARVSSSTDWISKESLRSLQESRIRKGVCACVEYYPNASGLLKGQEWTHLADDLAAFDVVAYHYLFMLHEAPVFGENRHPVWVGVGILRRKEDGKPNRLVTFRGSGEPVGVYTWNELQSQETHPRILVSLGTKMLIPAGFVAQAKADATAPVGLPNLADEPYDDNASLKCAIDPNC